MDAYPLSDPDVDRQTAEAIVRGLPLHAFLTGFEVRTGEDWGEAWGDEPSLSVLLLTPPDGDYSAADVDAFADGLLELRKLLWEAVPGRRPVVQVSAAPESA